MKILRRNDHFILDLVVEVVGKQISKNSEKGDVQSLWTKIMREVSLGRRDGKLSRRRL